MLVYRMTVDLGYPGEPAPVTRYQFFGATEEECEDKLEEQALRDKLLYKLTIGGAPEVDGMTASIKVKTVELAKVQKGRNYP
jgi:hypothetical protein